MLQKKANWHIIPKGCKKLEVSDSLHRHHALHCDSHL